MSDKTIPGKQYLGDNVFASFDGSQIWLRCPRENTSHLIILEPGVFTELVKFAVRCGFKVTDGGLRIETQYTEQSK